MTWEEAIYKLEQTKRYRKYLSDDEIAAVTMAIKILEQEPCSDAISRQAVLDIINFEDKWLLDAKSHNEDTKMAFWAIKSKISELPSVNPNRKAE